MSLPKVEYGTPTDKSAEASNRSRQRRKVRSETPNIDAASSGCRRAVVRS